MIWCSMLQRSGILIRVPVFTVKAVCQGVSGIVLFVEGPKQHQPTSLGSRVTTTLINHRRRPFFFIYFVHVTSTTIKISGGPVTFMSNAHCCYVTRGVNYLLSTLCTIPDNEGVVQQYEYTPPLLSEKSLASFDTHTHVAHRTTSGRYRSGGTYHESSLSALNYFK